MADYAFYTDTYLGEAVPETDFHRLSKRAEEQLSRYERIYVVCGDQEARDMAVCAMTDAMFYFEAAVNGGLVTSSSIGSVSSSQKVDAVDISPKAQAKELYRCASLYLSIYRR